GHFHFVGHLKPSTPFPMFLGHEDLNKISEFPLLRIRKQGIVGDVLFQVLIPLTWERLRENPPPASIIDPEYSWLQPGKKSGRQQLPQPGHQEKCDYQEARN